MPLFDYIGGGWFRLKGANKGDVAPMVHGNDVVQVVMAYLVFGS